MFDAKLWGVKSGEKVDVEKEGKGDDRQGGEKRGSRRERETQEEICKTSYDFTQKKGQADKKGKMGVPKEKDAGSEERRTQ